MTPFDASRLVMSRTFPSSTQKFVMLVLALYADEAWSCFPGQALLAANTGLTDRTVRSALSELEATGLISRKARFNGSGRTSDRYWLIREAIGGLPVAVPERISGTSSEPEIDAGVPEIDDIPTGSSFRVTTSRTTRELPDRSLPERISGTPSWKRHYHQDAEVHWDCIGCSA